jgi:uncharacterized membrane protein YfhO
MSKKKKVVANESTPATPGQAQPRTKSMTPDALTPINILGGKLNGKFLYVLLALIVVSCLVVFSAFISGEKVYLFKDIGSDSINIYIPWLTQLADYVKDNGIPTWTFAQGMGQNVFPLWMSDFFSNLLMLGSKEGLPFKLAYVEIAKIILCGIVFFKYLRELKMNEIVSTIGALLFAFSGYVVLGGSWVIFSLEALYIGIILYGFERWLNHGKWLWFVIGITCMSFLQPFLLFPHTLFLMMYIPVRYNDVHPTAWRKFPVFILKTMGFAVLAVAISSWQLFPDLLQYIESPRVGGEARLIEKLKGQPIFGVADEVLRFTTTFRAFGADMLGNGTSFVGFQNYLEAPLFYCGIFCLVAFPQAFSGFNKNQKIAYGIFAGLFALPILFPFFRYCFWAFTGDYFRTFSLVITLLLLIFTAKALQHIIDTGKVNLIVLGVTIAVLLGMLFSPSEQLGQYVNSGMRSVVTLLIFIYAGILVGLTRPGTMRTNAVFALLAVCLLEVLYSSSSTVNNRDAVTGAELSEKVGYNDYTKEAVNFIKSKDNSFYRINKDYFSGSAMHASINDAKAQGFFGTPSYHSFNQKNYIKFLGDVNVLDPRDENATRWARGVVDRPLLFSLVAGKYSLTRQAGQNLINFGYDSLGMFGNVKVFRNKFSAPLAFAYNKHITESEFKSLSNFQKDVYLLRGCVIPDDNQALQQVGTHFNLADTAQPFTGDSYGQYVSDLRKDGLTITSFKESRIAGNINLAAQGILFFSIPFDEGWSATVNGKPAELTRINCGFTGLKLDAGKSNVEIHFEPRLMKQGGMVSLLATAVFIGLIVFSYLGGKKKGTEAPAPEA